MSTPINDLPGRLPGTNKLIVPRALPKRFVGSTLHPDTKEAGSLGRHHDRATVNMVLRNVVAVASGALPHDMAAAVTNGARPRSMVAVASGALPRVMAAAVTNGDLLRNVVAVASGGLLRNVVVSAPEGKAKISVGNMANALCLHAVPMVNNLEAMARNEIPAVNCRVAIVDRPHKDRMVHPDPVVLGRASTPMTTFGVVLHLSIAAQKPGRLKTHGNNTRLLAPKSRVALHLSLKTWMPMVTAS